MKRLWTVLVRDSSFLSARTRMLGLAACATAMTGLTVFSFLQLLQVPSITLAEKFEWVFLGSVCGVLAVAMSAGVLLSLRMMRRNKS